MRRSGLLAPLLALALSVAGPAHAAPEAIGDLRDLSGTWAGEIRMDERLVPISVSIADDGQARIESGGVRGRAVLTIEGHRVLWQGLQKPAFSTLHREGPTRVLQLECVDGTCSGQLRAATATPSARTAAGTARPATAAPVAPSAPGRLSLTWKMTKGPVQGFLVERKTGDGDFLRVGRLLARDTTWVDESVRAGSAYCYRVRSFSSTGISAPSEEACATATPSTPTPTAAPATASRASAISPPPQTPARESSPAGRPIALKDAAPLVGRWLGELRTRGGLAPMTIVFSRDGTARWSVREQFGAATFIVDAGKIRWRGPSAATGELYEELGKPVIRLTCDDGSCSSRLSREGGAAAGCHDCGDTATRASGRSKPGTGTRAR